MPEPKQSSSHVGASAVWILLAAAGTYFVVHTSPLEGNRPPTTEAFLHEQPTLQDIESRLWRDPFAAVAEKLAKATDLKPENCGKKPETNDHCVSPLQATREQPGQAQPSTIKASNAPNLPPIVMVASVSGAPYSEDHESRRRQRYAIVAGLERQGFIPRDPEHLGFFWPRFIGKSLARTAKAVSLDRMPEVVPFEWFDRNATRCSSCGSTRMR